MAVSSGRDHTCAIAIDRRAFCWGSNLRGQLGNDFPFGAEGLSAPDYILPSPVPVSGGLRFVEISASWDESTCGLTDEGRIYCWGFNPTGVLGYGGREPYPGTQVPVRTVPTPIADPL